MECSFVNSGQRPVIRSSFARSLYERMIREEQLKNFDNKKWYKCDIDSLNEELRSKFIEMEYDNETDYFLQTCYQKSDWLFTHMFNSFARAILCLFMTSTSINGLLERGSMFVFSTPQFCRLYDRFNYIKSDPSAVLLDLGAGDGKVTSIMSQYFSKTCCTEISPVMKRILNKKGYHLLDAEKWSEVDLNFDLICGLNLLDRCDKPLTMIKKIKLKLKPNGRILLALVLPLSQYVESGSNGHKPSEILQITGNTLEEQLSSFNEQVIKPNQLQIVNWTKLPYLCEGDLDLSYYWLNDVVILLKRQED